MDKEKRLQFEKTVMDLLKNVMDPEIEINIVDLGLIYELYYDGEKKINIVMTFSTPACPLGDSIINNIKETILQKHPNFLVQVDVVFHPPWTTAMVSAEGKKILGM